MEVQVGPAASLLGRTHECMLHGLGHCLRKVAVFAYFCLLACRIYYDDTFLR